MMFSCATSEDIIPDAGKLPINISVGQQTRANDTTYENGDEVGIYVVNYDGSTAGTLAASGNQANNVKFTYSNNSWTPEETIYWKNASTPADFYAYYPYSASPNISAHTFAVQANQSSEDAFWASDFLWGKTTNVSPTPNAVAIQTSHSLSRILIDIKPGNGFTETSWATASKSVKICDVKTSATINLATGVATATGNNGEITPLATTKTGSTFSYKAMMIPQTVAENSKLVVVTVDGTDYVYRKGYTFSPNTVHKFTITVNKSGSSVNVTIGEWDIDNSTNEGDAVEEEESEVVIPNNQIWYTATTKVEPDLTATIISNEWDSTTGKGVITFSSNVTKIDEEAFSLCNALTSITIPGSVTTIQEFAFGACPNLAAFYGPLASEDNRCLVLRSILYAFAPYGLSKYVIPDNVNIIGKDAFNDCSSLTEIIIPENVTKIYNWAFQDCTGLSNITIPSKVTEIGTQAFDGCSNLKSLFCKAITPPTLPSDVFRGTHSDFKIYVPVGSADSYKTAAYWSSYASLIEEMEM